MKKVIYNALLLLCLWFLKKKGFNEEIREVDGITYRVLTSFMGHFPPIHPMCHVSNIIIIDKNPFDADFMRECRI